MEPRNLGHVGYCDPDRSEPLRNHELRPRETDAGPVVADPAGEGHANQTDHEDQEHDRVDRTLRLLSNVQNSDDAANSMPVIRLSWKYRSEFGCRRG